MDRMDHIKPTTFLYFPPLVCLLTTCPPEDLVSLDHLDELGTLEISLEWRHGIILMCLPFSLTYAMFLNYLQH